MSGSVSAPTFICINPPFPVPVYPGWTLFLSLAYLLLFAPFAEADILIFIPLHRLISPSPSTAARHNPCDVGNSPLLHRLANRHRHNADWQNESRTPSMLSAPWYTCQLKTYRLHIGAHRKPCSHDSPTSTDRLLTSQILVFPLLYVMGDHVHFTPCCRLFIRALADLHPSSPILQNR